MKTKLLLLGAALLLVCPTIVAQSADNEDEVVKIDKWNRNAFREGEIIVHFHEDSQVRMRAPQRTQFSTTNVSEVDQLFEALGVDSVEELMPRTGTKPLPRKLRTYNGKEIEPKPLGKLYRLKLAPNAPMNVHQVIDTLKTLRTVDFAEPNYILYTLSLPYDAVIPTQDSATYTAEPLYSQQWGPAAINLPALWNKPKRTSKRPVIAILDTGVDIDHPDLAANIWTNPTESNGVEGQDDDNNGFVDDLHGWDFINQTGIMCDFNGHGTHCAGIAAAVGNNGIGITGANPDALIMPVSVMQSDGSGDVATIVRGIDYAAANGADVISMSIGSYSYSIAEEQALGRAYANAVLVAAAGNDQLWIERYDITCLPRRQDVEQMFPACYTFVLGVEAGMQGGCETSFSNLDDNPIFSSFGEEQLYNYELRAPGINILSTFPGGRYKVLHGTSMACPLVAGAVSRLIQCKEILSKELLFGDLIHTRQKLFSADEKPGRGNIDILAAYNLTDADRHPELWTVTYNLVDTLNGDGDGRPDTEETVEIYPVFRNVWGMADNIRFWIKTGYNSEGDWVWDDTTLTTHLQDTVQFGKPLSSYAKATSQNPWRMRINPNCVDGRHINFTLFAVCDNIADTMQQYFVLNVENGVEIGGILTDDLTLYPNVHYIVTNNLAIPAGVTLTIKPGTVLKFKKGTGIAVTQGSETQTRLNINGISRQVYYQDSTTAGRVVAIGTPDSMIVFTSAAGGPSDYSLNLGVTFPFYYDDILGEVVADTLSQLIKPMEYVRIENHTEEPGSLGRADPFIKNAFLRNCIIENNTCCGRVSSSVRNYRCNYVNTRSDREVTLGLTRTYFFESNFCNNMARLIEFEEVLLDGIINSNYYGSLSLETREKQIAFFSRDYPCIYTLNPIYYGSSKESEVRKYIKDIDKGYGFGWFDLSNMLTRPAREAHGIVWKILVNGYDAQDEFDSIPPLGVGTHRCDVYFNRPMDISIAPTVSYGVRPPYTQHQIFENGVWSADSTIYTAYFTIDAKTVSDGLNRLRVYGAEDNEHFEIPEENYRFHFEISAAGSMSTGLMAEAGLGKVTLTWETDEEDFADLLGYNIYRWTADTIWYNRHWEDSCSCYVYDWKFDTICINQTLIDAQDSLYIDYDVIPGKDYYYIIRQMTTSLSAYDISDPVTARPLTAIKGDANGSMSVNVADVLTEVAYIMEENPQPFIFEAADVNSDSIVNIFDVVGTVNLILHPETQTNAINTLPAYYFVEDGILYVETDVVLGGVQVSLSGDQDELITPLEALNEFEKVSLWRTEEDFFFMAYSMSGKVLSVGKHALLQIGDANIQDIMFSDPLGHEVVAVPLGSTALDGTPFIPGARKFLKDGHLYIQIGNNIFSATGQLIH